MIRVINFIIFSSVFLYMIHNEVAAYKNNMCSVENIWKYWKAGPTNTKLTNRKTITYHVGDSPPHTHTPNTPPLPFYNTHKYTCVFLLCIQALPFSCSVTFSKLPQFSVPLSFIFKIWIVVVTMIQNYKN